MIPPDDDSKQAAPGCEVHLKTGAIRFLGCEAQEAMIRAAEKRLSLVASQLSARSGLTNKERRSLSKERNILRRWLATDFETHGQPGVKKSLNNLRRARRRKPTKRRARKARQLYNEQHTHLQRRPDYNPPPVISMDELERIRHLHGVREKKQAWFKRTHGKEVNETACHDLTTDEGPVCAETAQVTGVD